jgi:hypothetical protein
MEPTQESNCISNVIRIPFVHTNTDVRGVTQFVMCQWASDLKNCKVCRKLFNDSFRIITTYSVYKYTASEVTGMMKKKTGSRGSSSRRQEGVKKNHENARITKAPTEIQTQHLSNANLQFGLETNLLSSFKYLRF